MANTFAKHAKVGEIYLNTRYISPKYWEWEASLAAGGGEMFRGTADSLDIAQQRAKAAANLSEEPEWKDTGPPILDGDKSD